jgi:UDP-N-acetylmuramoyl-tripeptide--D-alanyl-D-alanine ligase
VLCNIANPTHGFITNIGRAHIGTFGGYENILRAKSELYQHLLTTNGVVFINSKNEILANMAKRFSNPILYPGNGDFYHAELIDADPFIRFKAEDGTIVQTQLIGSYNFENIAAALCIGKFFGIEAQHANDAVANYVAENMRSQILKKGTNTIILDAYNANPSSMEAAIRNLAQMKSPRKVAILGDMFELEEEAETEHKKLGTVLKEAGITEAYLCGKLIQSTKQTFPEGHYFENRDQMVESFKRHPVQEATVLVKASRGMALEKIIDVL